MQKKYDVTALGEILIDFTAAGKNADGKNIYEENPGGAPANCAAAVAKLGGASSFIGMTGEDSFGKDLKAALENVNVDTSGMRTTKMQHTTLAFVSLDQNGERNFSFCRNPGADTCFSPSDLDREILSSTKFLQLGSLSLTDEPSASAQMEAVRIVKQAGGFISYDPNYRERLWGGRKDALEKMKSMLSFSDMVKISDEELALFFGEDISYAEGAALIHECGVRLVLVTLGSRGVYYSAKGTDEVFSGAIAVPCVNVVDTTGAGDSFTGGLLYALTRRENPFDFSREELEMDVSFANCVASLCVTKRGAIPALPTLGDVLNFSKEFNIILPLWI